jgi:cell division protein FtsB
MAIKLQYTSHSAKLVIIGLFLMVSFLLYSLTTSVYKSYQIELHIKNYEKENAKIEEENRKKSEDYEYYSSDSYIEKIAKQNLGLVNPGEEVIIIPNETLDSSGIVGGVGEEDDYDGTYSSLSNPEKWWKFFFDMER